MPRQSATPTVFRLFRSAELPRGNAVLLPRHPATAPKIAHRQSAALRHADVPMIPASSGSGPYASSKAVRRIPGG